jgi:hypothetical protein
MVYKNCKLTDMVLMYEKADGNGREAQRLYSEAFPESRVPNHHKFAVIVHHLREKGEYRPRTNDRGRQRTARTLDAESEI